MLDKINSKINVKKTLLLNAIMELLAMLNTNQKTKGGDSMNELKISDKVYEVEWMVLDFPNVGQQMTYKEVVVGIDGRKALLKVLCKNKLGFQDASFRVVPLHFDFDLKHKITIW
jgi:hypothetical protein